MTWGRSPVVTGFYLSAFICVPLKQPQQLGTDHGFPGFRAAVAGPKPWSVPYCFCFTPTSERIIQSYVSLGSRVTEMEAC